MRTEIQRDHTGKLHLLIDGSPVPGAVINGIDPANTGVFYPFLLGPSIAALAMSGSSALVAVNALMLKRTKLTGIRQAGVISPAPSVLATAPA